MSNVTETLLKTWKDLKSEVQNYTNGKRLQELQKEVLNLKKNAEKDLKQFVGKDIPKMAKTLQKEKQSIEKSINDEIKQVKKYVESQKKELKKLQATIEHYVKGSSKKNAVKKATKKKAASKPKATKKVAASATTKKKVTKKK